MLKELDTLSFSFATELRRNSCVRIATDKDKYFQKDDLFGPKVSTAFPSCIGEIQAAGNCCALEQNEACVFHLMCILQRGLEALASRFNLPFGHHTWNDILTPLETGIKAMGPSFGTDWRDKRTFYSGAASHFRSLKDAWRNHVMHARATFDEGQALSVFIHVREFMQALTDD